MAPTAGDASSAQTQPLAKYAEFTHYLVTAAPGTAGQYVAHVEINRPAKLNAFFEAMWLQLGALFERLSQDPDIRAVVLSGAGDRAFTAGLDVQTASGPDSVLAGAGGDSDDPARRAAVLRRHVDEFQRCLTAVEKCEKPVVCVIHGISFGLAIDLSLCADVRVASADARMAVKEVDIGLAADIGTLARLPKAVGSASWVKDVCLSAREFGADEALRVGFVSEVRPTKREAVARAVELASTWASKSPVAVQGTKEILNHARDHSVADNLRYTAVWNSVALQSADVKEALLSGMRRTKPTFEKL